MLSIRRSLFNVTKSFLNSQQICLFSSTEKFRSARKYTEKHEWISLQGDIGTVGISDYAQEKLGEVVYLELPALGAKLTKGDVFATLESVKAVSECYTPTSGAVTEVNSNLSENPSLLNKSPHEEGN
jgi:glycine cleavage system H protein